MSEAAGAERPGGAGAHRRELSLPRASAPWVATTPDRPALVDVAEGYRATYAEHAARVAALSGGLRARLGLDPGDRFAVLCANGHAYVELWHAALQGAGVITPLNARLAPAELAAVLDDAAVSACVVDAAHAPLLGAALSLAGRRLPVVVQVGEGREVPGAGTSLDYEELLAGAAVPGASVPPGEPDEEAPAVLMYTGGTTGLPKGVLLSHAGAVINQYHQLMAVPTPPGWRYLQHTPMFHVGAMTALLRAPMTGGTIVTIARFEAESFMAAVEAQRIDFTVALPTIIDRVLSAPGFSPRRLSSLRRIAYGGAPMPLPLLERLRAALPDLELVQSYGMTEACANLTVLDDADHRGDPARLGTVGRALPGVALSVRDPAGRPLPAGKVGEICARGANLFLGYWNRPADTAAATAGGWYHSGDAGVLDEAGYLTVVDRLADMIVTGGENVYCAEVERAVARHPDVAEVAVLGLPDLHWGEAVTAVVVPVAGRRLDPDELVAFCRQWIAGYKVPKRVVVRPGPLPLSGANKVSKARLRAELR